MYVRSRNDSATRRCQIPELLSNRDVIHAPEQHYVFFCDMVTVFGALKGNLQIIIEHTQYAPSCNVPHINNDARAYNQCDTAIRDGDMTHGPRTKNVRHLTSMSVCYKVMPRAAVTHL